MPSSKKHPTLEAPSPEAMAVAEAAREKEWRLPSFVGDLFMGRVHTSILLPYPAQTESDRKEGDAFVARVEAFLKEKLDPDALDRTGEMPPEVIRGLAELGCFGIKIPKEYGGLGLSQTNYNRTIVSIASFCGSTSVWLSAHQSIGVPQPLMLFGTEEQKRKYLPRLAKGEISAFALTEPDVGSDPANMQTTAVSTEDGRFYILNGEKLWCTNGPVADVMVVMARTQGKERKEITAFIVERSMPGVEAAHRCDFMGLKGIQNGLLRFKNVKVPAENILWGPGQGLKLALITLNTGRLTLPAACLGGAKRCLEITRQWSNERVQWGVPVGKHEAVASKIGSMASYIFAMESMLWFTSALADTHRADIRLEAAMTKLFCSEAAWKIVDDTMQIRGGRGYETADSLRGRGEKGIPVERIMRDARINLIIEGTSEIMRLFIAREALDPHFRILSKLLGKKVTPKDVLTVAVKALGFYTTWYPRQWLSWRWWPRHRDLGRPLAGHLRYVEATSNRLARAIFHNMVWWQAFLQRKQLVLGRLVDIGTELFAMAAVCSRARSLLKKNPADSTPEELADLFCRQARRRVAADFRELWRNDDVPAYWTARKVMDGKFEWLEEGILQI